ncbi:prepilin-type N-terminal cleavage/methylation domain-containing protein [Pirellulaceae bacterium SH449]
MTSLHSVRLARLIRTRRVTASYPRPARRAFTLLEVLLVLAILAALAGLAAPTVNSMITSRKLSVAADQLINDIAEGRVRAIQTGQTQVFEATVGGRDYIVKPWLMASDEIDASAGATITTSLGMTLDTAAAPGGGIETSQSSGQKEPKELDVYVQFSAVETVMDTRSASAIQTDTGMLPTASAVAGGKCNPVLLYPDGSSTTAQIILIDQQGRRMVVQLRGIVGQMSKFQTTSLDPSAFVPAQ